MFIILLLTAAVNHFPFDAKERQLPYEVPPFVSPLFLYGPGGIRTHDLCVANAALSQLSYKPETVNGLQMRNLPLSQAVVKV